jgi:hypothetical protein
MIPLVYNYSHEPDSGSKEHFFHFFWGYLLPATREILRINEETGRNNAFVMESCGPLMDPLIAETASKLQLDIRCREMTSAEMRDGVLVERWDRMLRLWTDWYLDKEGKVPASSEQLEMPVLIMPDGTRFLTDILTVRNTFVNEAGVQQNTRDGNFLILKRSEEPDYYRPGGGAARPTYGSSRRSLKGIDEAVQMLNEHGYRVTSFEPGRYSLFEQIEHFYKATGVAGIRGAEFAGMIWMQQGSVVIMLEPPGMGGYGVQRLLASILNLNFTHLMTGGETSFPTLQPDAIAPYLPVNPS